MSARLAALSAFALISAAPAAAPAQPAAAPVNMAGTWDLTWQTRRGPERSGHLVVTQSGTRLTAQIHRINRQRGPVGSLPAALFWVP